ncbi:hypothetical protein BGX23_005870 [Mortierella sp. AD031]|nr:hypothetical protein BGX23_005870 [Mortierella sp. AD031]KAG0204468.1 hypothetical protein BGX33_008436 [Mortierella sp. NVP41]
MLPSTVRLATVAHARVPLIRFLGPRRLLPDAHHEAGRHPAAPKDAEYPLKAGTPSKAATSSSSSAASSASRTANVTTTPGAYGATRRMVDFSELPNRYRHPVLTEAEIEAVEAGGATKIY